MFSTWSNRSRSSPLAVAASMHPYITCISCFDERSLAFHAVGYARGSSRPAVVITSSGTAVSNLLPAVVEASQDFVPLLLLTADRPPELQDTGANQSINQVNHFGSFVRFFFNLPPPNDGIPARMALTTVDSAVYLATNAPYGPVHINCPFREPLEGTPEEWRLSCLKGLNVWMSTLEPLTKYIRIRHSHSCNNIHGIPEILELIRSAKKGLIIIGGLHTEDEMWSALLVVEHLGWPTVADILSGLRLRKVLVNAELKEKFLFIDHLDHALISDTVRRWAQADVIIQLGSRIISKRIGQMLEVCSPCSYIMVEEHPYRHDSSHIVTHRIQSNITEFANSLLKVQFPRMSTKWSGFLQALNKMVAWEIAFQIQAEDSLTEPHVAQVISKALPSDAALFIGNSMVIRDADMYGCGSVKPATKLEYLMSGLELVSVGIRASGNRGASGIDGLLSTAIGFTVGCNKRVYCVIGDISFLHDTNGLAILKQRTRRKPMTILVINNHGGAIFSLLPIADRTQPSILEQYFYTSHSTSVGKLCEAHSVNHLHVRTKVELGHALMLSQHSEMDCVVEVESCIEDNAIFHSILRRYACQAADYALRTLSGLLVPDHTSSDYFLCVLQKMEYSLYRIQLYAPLTSTPINDDPARLYREGFILALYLEDGNVGHGEVAPLEIHKENLLDVEEQLRFLLHVIQGAKISYLLPLLRGSFSSWIWSCLGILPDSLFPSVRCGLEMAILNALAARQNSSLSDLLLPHKCPTAEEQLHQVDEITKIPPKVHICALIDSNGTPKEVAHIAAKLVEEGFTTIKLKVGRRTTPLEDVAVIQEIRKMVGYHIKLRADANRSWTYEKARKFGFSVKLFDLQYIEEPVHLEEDIIKFCEETGVPVALDETIDNIQGDPISRLAKFIHPGIVALVIKPSVVGGIENAALIAKWAQQKEKMAVVSAAFESSLGLSAYIQFSYFLEKQNIEICKVKNTELPKPIAHGFGTYRWLKEDVTTESLKICGLPYNDVVEASVEEASWLLQNFKINPKTTQRSYNGEQVREYELPVDCGDSSYFLKVHETGAELDNNVVFFLHGFLGTAKDWIPVMKAISTSVRCISVDLPGHGGSHIQTHTCKEAELEPRMSVEAIVNILCKVISKTAATKVIVVGYSLGARIALHMALRCSDQIEGAVIISGSPGLKDVGVRKNRAAQDDAKAHSLTTNGLQLFIDNWYSGDLWTSLRAHPHFERIVSSRAQHNDVSALAKAFSDLSVGRQQSLWEDLKQCKKPLLFIYGEKDKKFKDIAEQMLHEVGHGSCKEAHEIAEVPECGHAVHLENPLSLISAVSKFLRKLNKGKSI